MNALHLGVDVGGTNLRFGVFADVECVASYRTEMNLRERCAQAGTAEAAQKLVLEALAAGYHRLREQCQKLPLWVSLFLVSLLQRVCCDNLPTSRT